MKFLQKTYKYCFLFSLVLIFAFCKKKHDIYIISGMVFDPNNQQAVANMRVELSAQTIKSGSYNASYSLLGVDYTDASGRFEFKTEQAYISNYRLSFRKENYLDTLLDISPNMLEDENPYYRVYNVFTISYLKITYKNINPVNESDYFSYRIIKGAASCNGCCSNNYSIFNGMTVDGASVCKTRGGANALVEWNVKRDLQNTMHYSKEVYCPNFDTAYINILY